MRLFLSVLLTVFSFWALFAVTVERILAISTKKILILLFWQMVYGCCFVYGILMIVRYYE